MEPQQHRLRTVGHGDDRVELAVGLDVATTCWSPTRIVDRLAADAIPGELVDQLAGDLGRAITAQPDLLERELTSWP